MLTNIFSCTVAPRAPTNWRKGKSLGLNFTQVFLCYDTDTGRELVVKQVELAARTQETSKVRKGITEFYTNLRVFVVFTNHKGYR